MVFTAKAQRTKFEASREIFYFALVIVITFFYLSTWIYFCSFGIRCFRFVRLLILLGDFLPRLLALQILLPFLQTHCPRSLRLFDPVKAKSKEKIYQSLSSRLQDININLLVSCFAVPRLRRKLPLSEKSSIHQLYDEIGFLRVGHGDLRDAFRVALWWIDRQFKRKFKGSSDNKTHIVNNDFPDSAALCALVAQIILILENQLHLSVEQLRLEEVSNDDSFLVLRTFASHLLRAPIEQSNRRENFVSRLTQSFLLLDLLLLHLFHLLLLLFLQARFQCRIVFATHLELGPLNADFLATHIAAVENV